MKKVLALVLAVIMVCTMAMANLNIDADTTSYTIISVGETAGSDVAAIEFEYADDFDFTETYVLKINKEYFDKAGVSVPAGKTLKDVVTVSGLKGVWAQDGNSYYVVIPVADKALDGKADFTIGSFTVKINATNYAEYGVKDGKVVMTKLVVGGLNKAVVDLTDPLDAAYDIGFKAAETFTVANGWYYTKDGLDKEVINANLTLTVPAKTYFKLVLNEVEEGDITLKAKNNTIVGLYDGASVTAGKLTMEVEGDKDTILYAVDEKGKLYVNPSQLVVTTDEDTDVETGKWTVSGTSLKSLVEVSVAETSVSGTTTEGGTTTNPGTGANDVVGVAAALAVVALVSGAAISLKK